MRKNKTNPETGAVIVKAGTRVVDMIEKMRKHKSPLTVYMGYAPSIDNSRSGLSSPEAPFGMSFTKGVAAAAYDLGLIELAAQQQFDQNRQYVLTNLGQTCEFASAVKKETPSRYDGLFVAVRGLRRMRYGQIIRSTPSTVEIRIDGRFEDMPIGWPRGRKAHCYVVRASECYAICKTHDGVHAITEAYNARVSDEDAVNAEARRKIDNIKDKYVNDLSKLRDKHDTVMVARDFKFR